MKDMAEKIAQPVEREKYYPHVTLTKEDIGDRKIGEEGVMRVKYKIVSVDISMGEKTHYHLELRKFDLEDGDDDE